MCQNLSLEEEMLRIVVGTFFGDWRQSEKLSEINPPLHEGRKFQESIDMKERNISLQPFTMNF